MNEPKQTIDVVLPWVDGADKEWLASYKLHAAIEPDGDKRPIRYRDWGLLRYWFRSVEQFMPWVGTIHLVTSGHIPEWLNLEHPKLNWVKHRDFIPHEFLPTFNVNTIELNLHHIKSLSERFIYFNDDIFVLQKLAPVHFFKNGLPCDMAVMTAKPSGGGIIHMAINDLDVIDRYFDKHKQIRKNLFKWFNFKYGKGIINNILLAPWCEFSGFIDPHLPVPFLKSTFDSVWELTPEVLVKTSGNKFRTSNDVNQWLMRYWQLAGGRFVPRNIKKNTLCSDITNTSIANICNDIATKKYKIICLNDSEGISDFGWASVSLQEAFEKILSQKSTFEK